MKKICILVVIFLASFLVFSKVRSMGNSLQHVAKQTTAVQKTIPTLSPTQMDVGIPQTISIPAIGVHASIEETGLDAQGRMGVPVVVNNTAWYKYGYRPGAKGSAVIDGHYDTVTGAPAVFYTIPQLRPNDTITITDSLNHTYAFAITNVTSYPYDQLPMQQIFASTDKARLNLITCSGTWDKTAHNYSNRAVVYSVLTSAR